MSDCKSDLHYWLQAMAYVVIACLIVVWVSMSTAEFFAKDRVPDVDGRVSGFCPDCGEVHDPCGNVKEIGNVRVQEAGEQSLSDVESLEKVCPYCPQGGGSGWEEDFYEKERITSVSEARERILDLEEKVEKLLERQKKIIRELNMSGDYYISDY